MFKVRSIIKFLLPIKVRKKIFYYKYKFLEIKDFPAKHSQDKKHRVALEKVRKKAMDNEKIKVVFFALHSSVWKYDELYKMMVSDTRFETTILVCPVVDYGSMNMLSEMKKTIDFFHEKGYEVKKSYNSATETFLDVKQAIDPDIIFYTNPYQGLIDDRYYITNFEHTLTCYVRYFFQSISVDEHGRDFIFHNRLWKFFCETDYHRKKSINHYSPTNNEKYIYTGYPGVDGLTYEEKTSSNNLSKVDINYKKIIWAPHHTIDANQELYLSNFLNYSQVMIDVVRKYSNQVQFIFKPHPLLKVKLYQHPDWGKDKTDKYYTKWENMPNAQLESNDYKASFNNSDAMIFDCNSFVIEYLYTGKPALFTFTHDEVKSIFNDFGKKSLSYHYHGYCEKDICEFIERIVLNGDDYKRKDREKFYDDYLIPPNNKTASENIFDVLNTSIWGK
jgi:hypothetical protein